MEQIEINGRTLTKEERGMYKDCRTVYTFTSKNGEPITVEMCKCESSTAKNSFMNYAVKNGYLPRFLPFWWSVDVQYETDRGAFIGYNPQIFGYRRFSYKGEQVECHHIINFDWILEATEENRIKLLAEIIKRADNKTPTPEKIDRETIGATA